MPYGFLNTTSALDALKLKLAALQYNGEPAFHAVRTFDMTDLGVALRELLIYSKRLCLMVHDIEQFETEKKGQELLVRQRREIVLLIADQNYASRERALLGDKDTPGAFNLKDAVLNNLVGLLQPGIYIEPVSGEQLVLESKERSELTGRVAFSQRLRLVGGNVIVPLGSQPIP